ncbi:MAG: AAA family ATPase [Deltaproteobacteria bacterium]|nr:AAA family ATPase [Deltaproteobacteria bacterium]
MHCSNCGSENRTGAKFCNDCGAPLPLPCPSCGVENRPGAKFCNDCGTSLVVSSQLSVLNPQSPTPNTQHPSGERRQLTVMFCDLVGSTALSEQLDPEELREVIQGYQATCAEVISRYDGHIAQYLGDGLLVYFGYPVAHEDDAARAVRAGLEIVAALQKQNAAMPLGVGARRAVPLQVRLGIHTGQVVVGEMGAGSKREQLALGDTPNIAARLQSLATPDTVVLSAATQRLVAGLFNCQDLGPHTLKGVSTPTRVYQAVSESDARNRFEAEASAGLTPLTGRDKELALLLRHWEQVQEGEGQVVLLSGEPGIGKSRLVREFRERVLCEEAIPIEFHCSPYHQNSAFYPIVDRLQRLLQWQKDEAAQTKLEKLQAMLARYTFPQPNTLPLLAALLSLPHPTGVPPLTLSPQRQKQKTQEALIAWLLEEAAQHTVCCAWEDLHWADPSTLEFLQLLIEQVPTARLYVLLTFRPEFISPWGARSHLSYLTLNRLGRNQISHMVENVASGKTLRADLLQQIIAKTDGVPLFVEELTKSVIESVGATHASPQQLAIPATLHDSLMARLDRLGPAREIAQLGAVIGREFSYELIHALSPLAEDDLQKSLNRLLEAELIHQRGLLPQARYIFKHALVQDAAYQSLLKSTRQQYHQQIAQVLEERFAEIKATQPELLAHHYTEAGLIEQAIPYWQQAGQQAAQRSANTEAFSHLTKGLKLLQTTPDSSDHVRQEITLQLALGNILLAAKGYGDPEVGQAYLRARDLCQQSRETSQIFPVLFGLWLFYSIRGELQTAKEITAQLLDLTNKGQDPEFLVEAYRAYGVTESHFGNFPSARTALEQALSLYDPQKHGIHAFSYGHDPSIASLIYLAWSLWYLGYPDQARQSICEARRRSRELAHPFSLAFALGFGLILYQLCGEREAILQWEKEASALHAEQTFPLWESWSKVIRGWTAIEGNDTTRGIELIRQGIADSRATGTELMSPHWLALLATAYGKAGDTARGLATVAEALAIVATSKEAFYEAELYRLKGELLIQMAKA